MTGTATPYEVDLSKRTSAEAVNVTLDRIRSALRRSGTVSISGSADFWEENPAISTGQRVTKVAAHILETPIVLEINTTDVTCRFNAPTVSIDPDGVVTIVDLEEVTTIYTPEAR